MATLSKLRSGEVYNYDTAPEFYAVADPFGRLLAKQTGAIRITASQIIAAAQAQGPAMTELRPARLHSAVMIAGPGV
jgi:hypothetical protein